MHGAALVEIALVILIWRHPNAEVLLSNALNGLISRQHNGGLIIDRSGRFSPALVDHLVDVSNGFAAESFAFLAIKAVRGCAAAG